MKQAAPCVSFSGELEEGEAPPILLLAEPTEKRCLTTLETLQTKQHC